MVARKSRSGESLQQVVLDALERGAIASEDAISAAMKGSQSFRAWVEASRAGWEASAPRRPMVRSERALPAAVIEAALAAARRRYLGKPGVVSVHWGLLRRGGRSAPQAGVVVTVERKRARLPRAERVAPSLPVRRGSRRWSVPADVNEVPSPGTLQAGVRTGNHAAVEVGEATGTLGAVLDGGDGPCAVVSGHVAQRAGLVASARTVGGDPVPLGRVERVLLGTSVDVARAGPIRPEDVERVAVREPVELYDVGRGDLNTAVWIRAASHLSPRKVFISDVEASARFAYPTGVRVVEGLIATSHDATDPGDSGAPAVDLHGRLVGFVLGVCDGRTYLVPARRALEHLET